MWHLHHRHVLGAESTPVLSPCSTLGGAVQAVGDLPGPQKRQLTELMSPTAPRLHHLIQAHC